MTDNGEYCSSDCNGGIKATSMTQSLSRLRQHHHQYRWFQSLCNRLLVADNFQNTGLGTKFMETLIAIGKERGLKSIYAVVLTDNNRMLTLMKKFGFTIGANSYGEVKISRQL